MSNFVLSYYDIILRKSDIDILKGNSWLNDTIIAFYFEYLDKDVYNNDNRILFLPPSITQCLKIMDENEFGAFLEPLKFSSKEYIFFAVNDNHYTTESGGSHWSLLLYSRNKNTFYHCDSMNEHNMNEAEILYQKLTKYLNLIGKTCIMQVPTIQQNNGYDCGIHVLCNLDFLIDYISTNKDIDYCHILYDLSLVKNKRFEILKLINILKKKT